MGFETVEKGRRVRKKEEEKIDNIKNLEWEFENAIPVIRNSETSKYVVSLNIFDLGSMYLNGLIYYKSSIQRGSKLNKNNVEIPIHRPSKVKEIMTAITSDNWHGGSLIINVETNKNDIYYNEETKTLKGHGRFYVIDGNHRLLAFKKLTELYIKGKLVQDIKNYQMICIIDATDDVGAAKIFSEHGLLPLKIQKSRAEFLQVDKLENLIARKIMKESELKNKIETISSQAKGDKVVSFNTIISGLEKHIKPKTIEEANAISDNVIKYINNIVNICPEILGTIDKNTRNENRKKWLAAEPMFFEAYLASFPELIGKDDIIQRLKSLRNIIKIDNFEGEVLDRTCPVWTTNIMINGKIVNKRGTKLFVVNTIKEYLSSGKLPMEYELIKENK